MATGLGIAAMGTQVAKTNRAMGTFMTTAGLAQIMAYVAGKRDAGEVEPQVTATARLQLMQGLFEHEDR